MKQLPSPLVKQPEIVNNNIHGLNGKLALASVVIGSICSGKILLMMILSGSVLTTNGTVEMEACIMDGNSKRCGAVSGVTTVTNPISLARKVMEKTPHIYLAFDGAEAFAREQASYIFMFNASYKSHFIAPENIERLKQAKEANRVQACLGHEEAEAIQKTPLSVALVEMEVSELYYEFLPKDVGKSILEGYSRVLESLSFNNNIVARIDDLLYRIPIPCIPSSGTPYKSTFTTPKFSPGPVVAPGLVDITPLLSGNCNKPPRQGFGVKHALTRYVGGEMKAKSNNCQLIKGPPSCLSTRNTDMQHARRWNFNYVGSVGGCYRMKLMVWKCGFVGDRVPSGVVT
ncbi:hypothetical protein M8C21_008760 [Ambrosia artemisiifolia]|uniref:beta-aspartyl-peptidase n=1 Tax=Ambrosia artemisiifolia TaxID=4212 RepID=A0AAD5DAB5_AMBAR|nr:hypothetical protein M8C21_008760 [Ambrosia artemisiifolia]